MATTTSTVALSSPDLEQLAQRVDKALDAVQGLPPEVCKQATDLKDETEAFHKLELTKMVLGQDDACKGEENRGGAISAASFCWPHAVAGDAGRLLIADAGNHRILGWAPAPARDAEASLVPGQGSFLAGAEFPYVPQGPAKLRFPCCLALEGDRLAVADTANHRILIWDGLPAHGCGYPADRVLGQENFDANGENRWQAVTDDSLCWPYGIWMHRGRLPVADSGNNRVTLWDLADSLRPGDPMAGA